MRRKVYRISHGKLQAATFLEESIREGCSLPTWLIIDDTGRKCRCSPGMYHATEREAWQQELADINASLLNAIRQRDGLNKDIADTVAEIHDIEALLRETLCE